MKEKEATRCYDQMLIVEKYETVISYLYPIAQADPQRFCDASQTQNCMAFAA